MGYQFVQGSVGWVDLFFFDDSTGAPVTGLVHNSATYKIGKSQGALVAKTTSAADWAELGEGSYQLKLNGGDTSDLGSCVVSVTYNGKVEPIYYDVIESVVTAIENGIGGTINTKVDTINAKIGTPAVILADDIAAIGGGGGGGPTAGEIADAVWDEARAGHVAAGSFGEQLDAAVSSRATPTNVTDARDAIRGAGNPTIADVQARLGAPVGASISADIATRASQTSVDAVAGDVSSLLTALRKLVPFGRSRETVLTRDPTTGAPLTTRIYVWDTDVNYAANGATGRSEYLATTAYHASGHITTHSVAPV